MVAAAAVVGARYGACECSDEARDPVKVVHLRPGAHGMAAVCILMLCASATRAGRVSPLSLCACAEACLLFCFLKRRMSYEIREQLWSTHADLAAVALPRVPMEGVHTRGNPGKRRSGNWDGVRLRPRV